MFENGAVSYVKWAVVIVIAVYSLKLLRKGVKALAEGIENVLTTIPKIPSFLNLKRDRFENRLERVFVVKVGKHPIDDEELSEEEKELIKNFPDDFDWDWKMTGFWDKERQPGKGVIVTLITLFEGIAVLIINLISNNKIFRTDFFSDHIFDVVFVSFSISSVFFIKYLIRQIPWASYKKFRLKKSIVYEVTYHEYGLIIHRKWDGGIEVKTVDAMPGDNDPSVFGAEESKCPLDIIWLLLGLFFLLMPVLHYYILIKGPVMQYQVSWWGLICIIDKIGIAMIMLTVPLTIVTLFVQKRRIKQSGHNSVFVLNSFVNIVKYIIGSVLIVLIVMALTVFFIKVFGI